jgi:NAD(P)-dependent dehydrogenase (short-subunit alcohol dehydrogenase family)
MAERLCEGRVVIVTGAGRGIGREYALMLAEHGAKVLVNDLGSARDGTPGKQEIQPAEAVVSEIRARGGQAVANLESCSDWKAAERMVQQAVDTFGTLHGVINNAGILRDRMLTNMTEAEWDAVINVHLKGTFAPLHHAANYWKAQHKDGKTDLAGRIINTSSASGLFGNVGQTNYGAAKAGIAALTIIAARELQRYGVTVNAISPGAHTRMTEDLREVSEAEKQARSPRWVAPIGVWLASRASSAVTGRVFAANSRQLAVLEGWKVGPSIAALGDPVEVGKVVPDMVARAQPNMGMGGQPAAI